MEACLLELERHSYLIADLPWFKTRALRHNEHDIVSLWKSLAQDNVNDMVCEFLLIRNVMVLSLIVRSSS